MWGSSLKELIAMQRVVPPLDSEWPERIFKRLAAPVYVAGYLGALREVYVEIRRRNIMSHSEFVEAVKADQAATVAWNRFLDLKREKDETPGSWDEVLQTVRKLEKIVFPWLRGRHSLLSIFNEILEWDFNLHDLGRPVLMRRCKKRGCAKVFFPKVPGQMYHSDQCAAAARQYKRYHRQKLQS